MAIRANQRQEKVLSALRGKGWLLSAALKAQLDFDQKAFTQVMRELRGAGKVERRGATKSTAYRIPEDGKTPLIETPPAGRKPTPADLPDSEQAHLEAEILKAIRGNGAPAKTREEISARIKVPAAELIPRLDSMVARKLLQRGNPGGEPVFALGPNAR